MDINYNGSELLNTIVLVSGPTKSGKSQWAQSLIPKDAAVTYIATAIKLPNDADWIEKIEKQNIQLLQEDVAELLIQLLVFCID